MPNGTVLIVGAVFVAGIGTGWLMGDERVTTVTERIPSDEPPTFVIHDVPVPEDREAATVAEVIPQDCAQAFSEVFPAVILAGYDLSRGEGEASEIISDLQKAQVYSDPHDIAEVATKWEEFTDAHTQAYATIGTETHNLVVTDPNGGMQIDSVFNQRCIVPMLDAAHTKDTG